MLMGDFKDAGTTSEEGIVSEVTLNFTATLIVARTLVPHFLKLGRPATVITVSSGLAHVPVPFWAVYNATKAAIHTFSVSLRAQLADTNVSVIELCPPYVENGLDAGFREDLHEKQGEKAMKPMPLKEYMTTAIEAFEREETPKEISTGFFSHWSGGLEGGFGPIFEHAGLKGYGRRVDVADDGHARGDFRLIECSFRG